MKSPAAPRTVRDIVGDIRETVTHGPPAAPREPPKPKGLRAICTKCGATVLGAAAIPPGCENTPAAPAAPSAEPLLSEGYVSPPRSAADAATREDADSPRLTVGGRGLPPSPADAAPTNGDAGVGDNPVRKRLNECVASDISAPAADPAGDLCARLDVAAQACEQGNVAPDLGKLVREAEARVRELEGK